MINNLHTEDSTWVKPGVVGNIGIYANPFFLRVRLGLQTFYQYYHLPRGVEGKGKDD